MHPNNTNNSREELLKADARAELAQEVADAPRKGRKERIADLTPEQDEKLRELIRRGDSLNDAYTAVEDVPGERLSDDARRRILAVLASERDKGWEEAHRYKEELGLRLK